MTYRGLRNTSLAFVTTLRMRVGKGTDNDQSQQCKYSKRNRPHGGLLFG
jgi:hypothetical protein